MPLSRIASGLEALTSGSANTFATGPPSPQATIDAVPSDWASSLPLPGVHAGAAELFADSRVEWALANLGGVEGAECVELGPLEGGHSYMLEHAGASSVTAIEANNNAYLKCLVVKELLGMDRCSFLYGDVVGYLEQRDSDFDVCWCAGILYHMSDPVRLLELISGRASRLYIWTHYYDEAAILAEPATRRPFAKGITTHANQGGFGHTLHRQDYGRSTGLRHFWGGNQPFSNWLELDAIVGALEHFGWSGIETLIEAENPHGPAVNLTASRG